ncbi:TIGR03862 family flavoprotein [Rhodobacteraceae bacterium nBUS_22]
MVKQALVIGGGPAGLMAAEQLLAAGLGVTITEAKPSFGRKFLMAGKSGLNLTKDEPSDEFGAQFYEAAPLLTPMLKRFGPQQMRAWADALGAEVFTGSSGRVFPKAMKASPLLRAWLGRLSKDSAEFKTRWRWTGWQEGGYGFDTPEARVVQPADVCVLALGGASWARLGSDGAWSSILAEKGVSLAPFLPANAALNVDWSAHMQPHFGAALKSVAFLTPKGAVRGEAIISRAGLEGSGIYSLSRNVRRGAEIKIDLLPDWSLEKAAQALSQPRGKASLSNFLRKRLKLGPPKRALLHEFSAQLPQSPKALAAVIKALPLRHQGLAPMDGAISTAGGVRWQDLSPELMLMSNPGVFCAGEMINWEAPTGGYLITGAMATGAWAGAKAAHYAQRS